MLAKIKLNFVTYLPYGVDPSQKDRRYIIATIFYSFESILSIFLGIVWIGKLHDCVGGSHFNISQGNTKKKLSGTFHGNGF